MKKIDKKDSTKNSDSSAAKAVKAAKVVKEAVVSHQWKVAKQNKLDVLLGHGGLYCLRKGDITSNLISEGKGKGASKRLVCMFKGSAGLCFLDCAFIGKVAQVGGFQIDTTKIKNVVFFGSIESAVALVKKQGKANVGQTKHGESFTHVLSNDAHYSIATDGKRLVRLEEWNCSGNAKNFCYAFGKAKKK